MPTISWTLDALSRQSATERGMETPERARGQGRQILVVDDDGAIRSFVSQALADDGYAVQQAANGDEALAATRRQRPDLILLDVRMPGVNGWQVLDELRSAAGAQTPVVVMTAQFTGQDRALQSGAQGYLAKPFELGDLLACVDLHSGIQLESDLTEALAGHEQ
jgi:DNA-binding response OmpR family regulator